MTMIANQYDDEEEETLSFYEFSIINEESNDSSFNSSDYQQEEDDYFEFFSEELKMSRINHQPENIIFCGKIIPRRQPTECDEIKSPNKNVVKEKKKQRRRGFYRWYLYLFGILRIGSEMELRDIKNRQSRRRPSFPSIRLERSGDVDNHQKRESTGAWGLVRALSCSGNRRHQVNAVVQTYRRR